jgi:hypothetical protein
MKIRTKISGLFAKKTFYFLVSVSVIILIIDYFTGKAVQLAILYVVPVGLAAWSGRRVMAYGFSILLPVFRLFFYIPWNESVTNDGVINALLRIVSLSLYAYFINRAKETLILRNKINNLENFLPICAYCKKIRDENGKYEVLETYIASRSAVQFTHGICPECEKTLNAEINGFLKDKK